MMRPKATTTGVLLAAMLTAFAVWLLAALPPAHRSIGGALILIVAVVWFAARRMIGDSRTAPLDEIGFWYLGILAVYAVIPLAAVLVLGVQYTPLNDLRLFELQPTPAEVARVAWLYALYLATFAGVYLLLRPRGVTAVPRLGPLRRSVLLVAGVSWLSIQLLVVVLSVRLDVSATSYFEQYRVMQSLPLVARQLFKLLFGLRFIFLILLLFWVMSRGRAGAWLVFAWLAVQTWLTIAEGGSRTELMVTYAAVLIVYHRVVRPLTVRAAVLSGAAGVALFLGLGLARDVQNLSEEGGILGIRANEFEAIFANAIDIQERKATGELGDVRAMVGFSDLLAVVPSQLAPYQKDDVADWYVRTFYPETKERGGGFAFGVVAQAIVGLGWLEILVRATIIAVAFALLHRFYRGRADRPWITILNVWAVVWAYESFRATTFYMLHIFLQQFVVAFLFIELSREILEGALRPARGRAAGALAVRSG